MTQRIGIGPLQFPGDVIIQARRHDNAMLMEAASRIIDPKRQLARTRHQGEPLESLHPNLLS